MTAVHLVVPLADSSAVRWAASTVEWKAAQMVAKTVANLAALSADN